MMVADDLPPGGTPMPPEGAIRPRSNSDPEVERTSSPHKHPPVNKQSSASQILITNVATNDNSTGRKPLREVDNDNRINVSTGNLPNNVSRHDGQYANDGMHTCRRILPTNHDRIGCPLEKSTSYQSSLCETRLQRGSAETIAHERRCCTGTSKRSSSDNSIPKCGLSSTTTMTNSVSTTSNVNGTSRDVENRTRGSLYKKNDLGRPSVIVGSAGNYHISYHSLQRPKKTANDDVDLPTMVNRRKSEPPNFSGMLSIEDEDYLPSSIVLDWDSYPSANSATTNGEGTGGVGQSVATIEVTNLGYKEPSVETSPRRPSSLNGSLNLNAGTHSALASPVSSSLTNVNGTPLTPRTPVDSPAGTPVGPLPSFAPVETDASSASHTSTPRHEGGTLHGGGTSASSFASVSSLNTEYSTTDDSIGGEEGGFVEVNLYTGGGSEGGGERSKFDGQGAKPKKKGIAGFLARNLFPWKSHKTASSDSPETQQQPGWKLFGKGSAGNKQQQGSPSKHMEDGSTVVFPPKGKTHPPSSSLNWRKRQSGMRPASSTTALILENRPQHLPAKNPEEEQKHKEEYEEMIKGAKKKEMKMYKQKMKQMSEQIKLENSVQTALSVWQNELLPNWESHKTSKRTRDIWWQGIPPSVRGRLWALAIGNELNITDELFEIFLARAKDRIKVFSDQDTEDSEEVHAASREDSVEVIKLDVARTFPQLCIFQKGGPYFDILHSVLGAYACYRPDVGYVQGMSFIAAIFLLYLDPADAFICFANLLNKSCQLAFFRLEQPVMQSYFSTYEDYFQDNLPNLFAHFKEQELTPDLYIIEWLYTLHSKSLPLDVTCRVWDVFLRDGEEFLFRTALGILLLYEDILLSMDFIQLAQFLTKLPEDIDNDKLFKCIAEIDMHQKKFSHVLALHLAENAALSSSP